MSRTSISNLIIPVLLFLDGLALFLLAILANWIGLDPNPGWGPSRYGLLCLGLAFLLISLCLKSGRVFEFITMERMKIIFLFGHVWAIIFVIYTWFITYGNFTTWQNSTRYYGHLADAFTKGQLYVDIKPNAELLEAADPYNPKFRPHFDDEIWDMSLYKGKLYIYWGPVPALLMTPFQFGFSKPLFDIYPVFLFFCGLLIVNSLILLKLWQEFFGGVPLRNFLASIILVGLVLPILWSINVPDVYEAAIGAGQLFLTCGIYFSLLSMNSNKGRYLFFAGFSWACAVGSRAIDVFSVIYMFALLIIWIVRGWRSGRFDRKKLMTSLVSLTAPLALGAILLSWYNWARFGSPFEFGLRYQITIYNLNRDMNLTFQPDYFPFNFYAYILQPFKMISRFPFVEPVKFSTLLNDLHITSPKLYAAGPVTGILFYAPFLLLAFLPAISRKRHIFKSPPADMSPVRKYFLLLLWGSFLINFMIILFYFYGQMRFLVDVISQLSLLAIMGYWELVQGNTRAPSKRTKGYVGVANTLLVVTLLFSFLLSFSSEAGRMGKLNPALMENINSIFTVPQK